MATTKKSMAIARGNAAAAAKQQRRATNGSQPASIPPVLVRPSTRNMGQRRSNATQPNSEQTAGGSRNARLETALAEERRLQEEEEQDDSIIEEDEEEAELAATLARVERLKAQKAERDASRNRIFAISSLFTKLL